MEGDKNRAGQELGKRSGKETRTGQEIEELASSLARRAPRMLFNRSPQGGSTAAPVFALGGIGEVHAYRGRLWRMKDRGRAVRIALALGIDSGNILGKFSAF